MPKRDRSKVKGKKGDTLSRCGVRTMLLLQKGAEMADRMIMIRSKNTYEWAHKCMVQSPTKDWPAIKRWMECVWKHGRKSNKIIVTHVSEPISLSEYRCLLGQRRCKPLGHSE